MTVPNSFMRISLTLLALAALGCSSATAPGGDPCAADERSVVQANGQPDAIVTADSTTVYRYNAHPPALPNAEEFSFTAHGAECAMQQTQF